MVWVCLKSDKETDNRGHFVGREFQARFRWEGGRAYRCHGKFEVPDGPIASFNPQEKRRTVAIA